MQDTTRKVDSWRFAGSMLSKMLGAAIEHPFGRPYGDVGDAETQRAVLLAGLRVFEQAKEPGHIEHLPFVWHEDSSATKWHPAAPSPIIALMKERQAKRAAGR